MVVFQPAAVVGDGPADLWAVGRDQHGCRGVHRLHGAFEPTPGADVTADGLPVGVQVVARFGDDAGALRAAGFVEKALARG